jgi:hypothetical protein
VLSSAGNSSDPVLQEVTDLAARVSMESDVEVRDVAERFVETGQLRPG